RTEANGRRVHAIRFSGSRRQRLDLLGAKGVVECELVSSGERWGRGPSIDVHSSNRSRLDSPAFHLVQALATLVNADGDPAIDGFGSEARPATAEQKAMLDAAATRISENTAK